MLHVSFDEMPCCEGTAEGEFAGQDGSGDDTGEAPRVVSGGCWVRAPDAEHVKHSALGFKNGTATESTDLQRRHGDGDLQGSVKTVMC